MVATSEVRQLGHEGILPFMNLREEKTEAPSLEVKMCAAAHLNLVCDQSFLVTDAAPFCHAG